MTCRYSPLIGNRRIPTCKKVTKETFASIVTPLSPQVENTLRVFLSRYKTKLPELIQRYVPWVKAVPLEQGFRFEPSWKALPTWFYVQAILRVSGFKKEEVNRAKSPFLSFPFELASWAELVNYTNARPEHWTQGSVWMHCTRYPLDKNNKMFSGWGLERLILLGEVMINPS